MPNIRNLEGRINACIPTDNHNLFYYNAKQKELEKEVLSLEVENFDDLEVKARVMQRILQQKGEFSPFCFSNEKMLKLLLHDIMTAYAQEKCKFDGSYGPKAPSSYFHVFYPNCEPVEKK